jgi:predicted transcriptional regulator
MPCLITMSQNELHRLEAVQKIRERRLTVTRAAEVLHLSRSQVHRLLQAYDRDGAEASQVTAPIQRIYVRKSSR